jgi:hypothetical protein
MCVLRVSMLRWRFLRRPEGCCGLTGQSLGGENQGRTGRHRRTKGKGGPEAGGQHQRQLYYNSTTTRLQLDYNCWKAFGRHEHTERHTSEVPLKNCAKGRAWASGTECPLLTARVQASGPSSQGLRDAPQHAAISSFSRCDRLQPHPNLFASRLSMHPINRTMVNHLLPPPLPISTTPLLLVSSTTP